MSTRFFCKCNYVIMLFLQLRFHVHIMAILRGRKSEKMSAGEFREISLLGLVKGLFYFLEFRLP